MTPEMWFVLGVFSACLLLHFIFKPLTFRFQRVVAVICVFVIACSCYQLGKTYGNLWLQMTYQCYHTRFVKDLFHRLSEMPPETLRTRMEYLYQNFELPSHYWEEGSKEQERLLRKLLSSDTPLPTPNRRPSEPLEITPDK